MTTPRPLVAALVLLALFQGCASSKREDRLLQELADLDKQTIFDRAEALYADEKYTDAREVFSFLYDTFPNDPLGHKAALRIADAYAVRNDSTSLTEARLRYRDFANRYPNDPDRDYALLRLGQTHAGRKLRPDRDLSHLQEALDAYQQLITLYPSSPYVEEGRAAMGEVLETLAEHEMLVARFYVRNGRWRGALWRLHHLKEKYPGYSKMAEVDTMIAELESEVERLERLIAPAPPAETESPDNPSQEQTLTRGSGVE